MPPGTSHFGCGGGHPRESQGRTRPAPTSSRPSLAAPPSGMRTSTISAALRTTRTSAPLCMRTATRSRRWTWASPSRRRSPNPTSSRPGGCGSSALARTSQVTPRRPASHRSTLWWTSRRVRRRRNRRRLSMLTWSMSSSAPVRRQGHRIHRAHGRQALVATRLPPVGHGGRHRQPRVRAARRGVAFSPWWRRLSRCSASCRTSCSSTGGTGCSRRRG